jgi:hypothetical protein
MPSFDTEKLRGFVSQQFLKLFCLNFSIEIIHCTRVWFVLSYRQPRVITNL